MSTTTRTRKPRQRRSHVRTVKVLVGPAAHNPLVFVRITQDGKASYYWIAPIPSDFGKAYRVEKPAPELDAYDVLLDAQAGDSCTCPGHTYGGYCKHVDCCRVLVAAGKLS